MKTVKRILSSLLVLCMVLALIPAVFAAEGDITICFTNDVHGAYEYYAYAATAMKDADLIVDAGDAIEGSVATTLTKGQCMIDMMEAVGYDLAVPGNHEFIDTFLTDIVKNAKFPYVSCNFMNLKDNTPVMDAYKIFEVNGKKVAFVGITTPETLSKSTPTTFQNEKGEWIYDFCNDATGEKLYKTVQAAVDAAKKKGADYVIAVGHLGIDEQSEPWTSTSVIKNTTGIDALFDGHSHSTFSNTQKNKDGKDVLVAQTGTKLVNVGKLTISAAGEIKAELVPIYETKKDADGKSYIEYKFEPDGEISKAVQKITDEVKEISEKVVAKTDVDLTTLNPETGKRAVRNAETNLGDLCADAYRDLLKCDVAFVNGGGVRADITKGDITYGDIINVHPFGNTACMIEVTGEQIWQALELGAASYPGESGGFLQVSGIEYTINQCVPSPVLKDETGAFVKLEGAHRVTDVKIGGKPLDVKKTYTLGGHNYMLLKAGDGYTMFKGAKVLREEVMADNQVLIRYITETLKGTVTEKSGYGKATGAGRITIADVPFTDVNDKDWFYKDVTTLTASGVIKGMTETTFEPQGKVTRAQFITMLYRLDGAKKVEDGKNTFTDLAKDAYYTDAINWGVKNELIKGMSEKEFAPEANITREQIATILFRYATFAKKANLDKKVDLKDKFKDSTKVSDYAKDALQWAAAVEVVKGEAGNIRPLDNATRAEAAALMVRINALPLAPETAKPEK